jgi:TPP-dependent pyruvate/acetoin dehydrogenase alpha subunit
MKVDYTPEDLIKFENTICNLWNEKKIKAPIHLDNGNEHQLIDIFTRYVNEEDWVLGSWRQHYKCLLKGVPQNELIEAILAGKSISLCFPEFNVISSAIVGGSLPIALGIALAIKRQGGTNKAVCFVGDMSSETGIAHECIKYSTNHNLPVLWVIEDNDKSVCTPTREVWGSDSNSYEHNRPKNVIYYKYQTIYPHAGPGGQRIQF